MNINTKIIDLIVEDFYHGYRLDKYISSIITDISRSSLQKLIKNEMVLVNEMLVKQNYNVSKGDNITIKLCNIAKPEILPENIPLNIIHEDDYILIINKPKNMVVHPGTNNYNNTLVNALLYHYPNNLSNLHVKEDEDINLYRPGIVHRLDQNTTGILIVCKNNYAHNFIANQFKANHVLREYRAIVYNYFNEFSGHINAPIGRHPKNRLKMAINYENGKDSLTKYEVIEELNNNFTYIKCFLKTGRTHQIRVHMSSILHPILGDELYGPNKKININLDGQALHSYKIGFIHPKTEKYCEFTADIPDYFNKILSVLKK